MVKVGWRRGGNDGSGVRGKGGMEERREPCNICKREGGIEERSDRWSSYEKEGRMSNRSVSVGAALRWNMES